MYMINILTECEKDAVVLRKEIIVSKLNWTINNWDLIKYSPNVAKDNFYTFCIESGFYNNHFDIRDGLCLNCGFLILDEDINNKMFSTYPNFSGDYDYPLSNFENYFHITNFANTPERLELAKHCLDFLENERWKEHFFVVESI